MRISVTPSPVKVRSPEHISVGLLGGHEGYELRTHELWVGLAVGNQIKVPESWEWEQMVMLRVEGQETFLHTLIMAGKEMLWKQTTQEA